MDYIIESVLLEVDLEWVGLEFSKELELLDALWAGWSIFLKAFRVWLPWIITRLVRITPLITDHNLHSRIRQSLDYYRCFVRRSLNSAYRWGTFRAVPAKAVCTARGRYGCKVTVVRSPPTWSPPNTRNIVIWHPLDQISRLLWVERLSLLSTLAAVLKTTIVKSDRQRRHGRVSNVKWWQVLPSAHPTTRGPRFL